MKSSYTKIASFKDIDFEYGLGIDRWVLIDKGIRREIEFDNDNYISFLRLFELDKTRIFDETSKSNYDETINKLLPIEQIVNFTLNINANYWSILLLDFVLENNIVLPKLKPLLASFRNEKWMSQNLKHKIKKYYYTVL